MYMSDQPARSAPGRPGGYLLEMDQPALGTILLEGPAFHATGLTGHRLPVPAPLLGQHTGEICTSLLGRSDADVDRMLETGLLVESRLEFDCLAAPFGQARIAESRVSVGCSAASRVDHGVRDRPESPRRPSST